MPSVRGPQLPRHQACLAAYIAACALVPPPLRRDVILIGGAAALDHEVPGSNTNDTDIACCLAAIVLIDQAADQQREDWRKDSDGELKWGMTRFGFCTKVELLLLPGEFVPRTLSVVSRRDGGFVATLPELLRLRCETVVCRGDDKDARYLELLLDHLANRLDFLPRRLGEEELTTMVEAVSGLDNSEHYLNIFRRILPSILRTTWDGILVNMF